MKKLLSLFFTFLALPSAMQGMLRRSVVKPTAPQVSRQAPKVPSRSIVDVRHLKNVHRVIKPEYAHLSPLVGASLIESDFLKKLYQFAPNHPTTRLLNDPKLGLFHLQNTQFRDTQSLSMPGKSLNPELIGEILGHLQTGRLNKSEIQSELIKKWKKNLIDTFKASISSEKLSQFLKLVQDSKNAENDPEENKLFIPHMTEGILTGFLHRKATKKEELVSYLKAVHMQIPILKKDFDENLVNDNYSSLELNQIGKKLKSLADDSNKQLKYIEKDFEGVLCTFMHQNSSTEVPPQVLQNFYGFQDQVAVANCTECAVHDLCNIILADSKGSFNFKLLPSTVKPKEKFYDFYTKYPSYTTVNDPKVGQAWMDLLSNHKGIIYVQKNYEVECFADNILNLLNVLFNIKAKSWKEFSQLLSHEQRTISCKEKIKGKTHTVSFSIEDKEFDLVIESGQHTSFSFYNRKSDTFDSISTLTRTSLYSQKDSALYLATLVPLLPSPLYYIEETPLSKYLLGLFASISDQRSAITNFLQAISPKAKNNPLLRETLVKMVKKLPEDDHYLMKEAFKAIVKSGAFELSEECAHFIKTYPSSAAVENLEELLECCVRNPEVGINQIKSLLDLGAKVSYYVLYSAIREKKCNFEVMQELIKKENILALGDSYGYSRDSLLAISLFEWRHDVATLLLDIISSPECTDSLRLHSIKREYDGITPMEIALAKLNCPQKFSYLKIVKKLIELGAMTNVTSGSGVATAWIRALTELLIFREKDSLEDVIKLIKLFCDKVDVNIANDIGDTTLSQTINYLRYASCEEKKSYYYQIIELLLKVGANPQCFDNNSKSISALTMAIEIKDKRLEDLIRSSTAKPVQTNNDIS